MKRVGNYGSRKKPATTTSAILRLLFDHLDARKLYARDVRPDLIEPEKTVSRWRHGHSYPSVVEAERMADRMGLEFVLREKAP